MKVVKLKDICTKGSSSLKQKDVQGKTGKYPVFGASGLIGYIDSYHQEKEYIGIVKDGSGIGRVMFLPPKSSVIGTLQYILTKPGYDINYIGYCLLSLDLSRHKQGAAIPHIYFKDYGERIITIDENIEEQRKIVNRLNCSFEKIDSIRKNAEQAKTELTRIVLEKYSHYFGPQNNSTQLGSILNLRRGHDLTHAQMIPGDIPVAGSNGIIGWHNERTNISPCVTVGRSGSVGMVNFYDSCWAHNTVLYVDNYKGNNPRYIYHLLKGLPLKEHGGGVAVPTLNRNNLHPLLVGYTHDIKEQIKISQELDELTSKIKKLEDNYNNTVILCNDLKQALLKKTFE